MIISIGHDITEIARIHSTHQRYGSAFLEKIYTPKEIDYCMQKANPYPSLAARFAAKESVAKAFRCGIGHLLHWKSVETLTDAAGAPYVHLDPLGVQCLQQCNGKNIFISLTHTQEIASAVAIISR